jgi:UDP-N-acetylglucosamine 2-epimerase (non-hydrolysing)
MPDDALKLSAQTVPGQTFPDRALLHVVGARPNFMKLAPVFRALAGHCRQTIVHTGQHYDSRMSGDFFDLLGLPDPDFNLGVGSGPHGEQTARIMIGLEKLFTENRPAAVIVYGDVNSTLAATLVATKLLIPCIHVEAGLRSRDRAMPEEQNRLVTDQLSDVLLTHSREADRNLMAEGIPAERIHFVGNVMIDTLLRMLPVARASRDLAAFDLPDRFALVTLHRPSNVDDPAKLAHLVGHLNDLSDRLPILFPVHPRTRARLEALNFTPRSDRLRLMEPMDYLHFILMQDRAAAVITDSGGIQEETTCLGTPCLTLRTSTERPVTVETGTNTLVGDDPAALGVHIDRIVAGTYKTGGIPEYWDGRAGERIRDVLGRLAL